MTMAFALPIDWMRTLRASSINVGRLTPHGPQGIRAEIDHADTGERGVLIASQADYPDGVERIHASMSWQERVPTYAELVLLHRAIFGRKRYAYQVFAPELAHVNVHPYALHLWGRVDGKPELGLAMVAELVEEIGSI